MTQSEEIEDREQRIDEAVRLRERIAAIKERLVAQRYIRNEALLAISRLLDEQDVLESELAEVTS